MRLIIIIGLLLAGCAIKSVPMQTEFISSDYDKFRASGKNRIVGQAFLKQQGGTVVTCAGNPVALQPDTAYFQEYWQIVRTKSKPIQKEAEPGEQKVTRQGTCDAQGNFSYEDIPDGKWIVTTHVSWRVGYTQQGGIVSKTIEVSGGKEVRVLLTDTDRIL